MKIMPGPERDGTLLKCCAVLAIAKRKWAYVTVDFDKLGPVKPMLALFDILTPHPMLTRRSGDHSRVLEPAARGHWRQCMLF